MYRVFKQGKSGVFVEVSSCDALEEAVRRVEVLSRTWPGKYLIRDPEGNDIDPAQ